MGLFKVSNMQLHLLVIVLIAFIGSARCFTQFPEFEEDGSESEEYEENRSESEEAEEHRSDYYEQFGFTCGNGQSISIEKHCNGHEDCPGGEDELNCTVPSEDYGKDEKNYNNTCDVYKCLNGKCLDDMKLICNGEDDCGDNSDEFNCASKCSLEDDLFACHDNSCLRLDMVCDGKQDCIDGSDESPLCEDKPCSALKCPSNKCKQLPTGPKCHCGNGYRPLEQLEGKSTCEDIDECSENPVCSHKCTNLPGTFACDCIEDFHLDPRDNQTCLSNTNVSSFIYYSAKNDIYKYNLEDDHEIKIEDRYHSVVGIAADDSFLYWTENWRKGQIVARMRHNSKIAYGVPLISVGSAEGLAVDWWTHNLYYTDSIYEQIVVCGSDTFTCAVLITKDLHRPRGIAVNPATAQMFWSDWGDRPYIGVAFMNGEGQRALVDQNIGLPNGIAIDYPSDRLFWVDAETGTFESILLNGKDRKVVQFGKFRHPFNVQVLGTKLYWTKEHQSTINSMDKHSGRHTETLFVKEGLRSFFTYHPLIQKKINDSENPCHQHNCSQLCLLAANRKFSCACSKNRLLSFGGVCEDRRTNVLIGYDNSVFELDFKEVGSPKLRSLGPQQLTKNVINRMAYNQDTGDIFIADNIQRMIMLFRPGFRRETITLVDRNVGNVSSMAVMAVDHHAHTLYWTDLEQQTLEMLSPFTRLRTIVHKFDRDFYPYAVVLAPQSSKIFVAVNKNPVKIFEMDMYGAGKSNLSLIWEVAGNETEDVALTIDEENSVIYAAVGRRIISLNYAYTSDKNINQLVMIPENKSLFWTGGDQFMYWDRKSLKLDKSMPIHLADKRLPAIPIITMPPTLNKNDHPCMAKNGGCSDICVSLGNGFTCMCSGGGQVAPGEQCPYSEDDGRIDFVANENEGGSDGVLLVVVLLILSFVAGAAYYICKRRYQMPTSSATSEVPPAVIYKPKMNMDPESQPGSGTST